MKIERINENQIRCTLTREDLVARHIKLSELAYGSNKAKELFRELMEQASYQYGFDADDIPLMIEAIPLSSESVILLVTKVENPDEMDTRFSRFTEDEDDPDEDYMDSESDTSFNSHAADDILNAFSGLLEKAREYIASAPEKAAEQGLPVDITKMFVFKDLDTVIELASMLELFYHGRNSLYKSPADGQYYLVVSKSDDSPEVYNKTCNVLSEYGDQANYVVGAGQYMAEHYETIVADCALQALAHI